MKVLTLLIITSIITFAAARVAGPTLVDSRKNSKQQSKQDDDEGVIVDPVITVSNIHVYENSSPATASVEENSVEVTSATSSELTAPETESPINEDDANPINRYCKCTSFECDCCREFSLPLVPIRGPGCANIRYLEGDRMSIGIKFGNRVLANRVISGRKETPVCLPLPGGFTNFCGRVYGISKKNEDFKACLGLELRADEEVEAALRVSCFSFGPKGLKVMEAEPIPVAAAAAEEEDDDDDFFGLGGDSDDEDDDILEEEDDTPAGQSAGNVPNTSEDSEEDDFGGLGIFNGDLFDDLLGGDDESSAPAKKSQKKKRRGGTVKKPSSAQNEVDGSLSVESVANDDDDYEEEEESGGFLELLNDFMGGDEDDEQDEEKLEDEISEEIAENELEDAEEIVEETDDQPGGEKDNEIESQDDLDEQELDDDDDDDDDVEDALASKPSTYAGLSLLGLRNLFSRFFK